MKLPPIPDLRNPLAAVVDLYGHEDVRVDLLCNCNRRLDVLELGYDWREDAPCVVRSWGSTGMKTVGERGRAVESKPTLVRKPAGPGREPDRRWRYKCHPRRHPSADYVFRWERVEAAFASAVLDGRPSIVVGVDL